MKKEWKAVIAVILSVWLFVMGFELGSYKEKKNISKNNRTYVSAPATTAAPTTTAPAASSETELTLFSFDDPTTQAASDELQELLTTMDVPDTTAAPATTAAPGTTSAPTTTTKADPSSMSKKDVLAAVTTAMRQLKSEQNMTAIKTEATKLTLTDCSAKAAVGLVNRALENAGVNETVTYNFQNGQAVGVTQDGKSADDGKSVSPRDVIPPAGQDFSVSADGVQSATAKQEGPNTVYTIKLVKESTTLESPIPPHNAKAIGYVDFSQRKLTGVTLSEVNMTYPGSVVTVTVNDAGKVVRLGEYLPLQGSGAAKVTVFSGTATFEGDVSATWTFAY